MRDETHMELNLHTVEVLVSMARRHPKDTAVEASVRCGVVRSIAVLLAGGPDMVGVEQNVVATIAKVPNDMDAAWMLCQRWYLTDAGDGERA